LFVLAGSFHRAVFSPPLQGEGWVAMLSVARVRLLVIPAQAGIQVQFHSACGRAGYFLALPQKVTKKV
jgi:hypothetical protein